MVRHDRLGFDGMSPRLPPEFRILHIELAETLQVSAGCRLRCGDRDPSYKRFFTSVRPDLTIQPKRPHYQSFRKIAHGCRWLPGKT